MNDLQWYDYMRLLTALFAVIGLYRCSVMFRTRRIREKLNLDRRRREPRLDDFFWVVAATMIMLLVGNLEQVAGNTEFRSAGILGFMITLVTLRATRNLRNPITNL